ncbi:TPA: glycosyltransferase [Photobacterium damselae]
MMSKLNIGVIIPTRNGGYTWQLAAEMLSKQDCNLKEILVIDSESSDSTVSIALEHGFSVKNILAKDFNHGGTRNLAVSLFTDIDILIFLTQDAILYSQNSISEIIKHFEDPMVGAVCGKQIPHENANLLAQHARKYNYPSHTAIKSKNDISELGIKTVFMSNSFSAYRKEVFDELGGFSNNTILGEDMFLASKMVINNYKLVYSADSIVYHSHNYSLFDEFKRYFDTGVFHANEKWIIDSFGKASGEGKKFVLSELKFLYKKAPWQIPKSIFFTGAKFIGYKMGLSYKKLPLYICIKFSMYKSYWNQFK